MAESEFVRALRKRAEQILRPHRDIYGGDAPAVLLAERVLALAAQMFEDEVKELAWIRGAEFLSDDVLELELSNGRRLQAVARRRGGCKWRSTDGKNVSDERVATEYGLPVDFRDAVAVLIGCTQRYLAKEVWQIHEEERARLAGREAAVRAAYDAIPDHMAALERNVFARATLGRHPELSRWRFYNPTPESEAPDCLRDVRHAKRLDVELPCHVYFLLKNGEVVYVGQTSAPWPSRILTHIKEGDKDFDDIWFIEVDRPSLLAVETAFIEQFQPKYNTQGVRVVEVQ